MDFRTPTTIGRTVVGRCSRLKTFYGLSLAVPWVLWLLTGWVSGIDNQTPTLQWIIATLGMGGLLAPVLVACWLVARDPKLRRDALARLDAGDDHPRRSAGAHRALSPSANPPTSSRSAPTPRS